MHRLRTDGVVIMQTTPTAAINIDNIVQQDGWHLFPSSSRIGKSQWRMLVPREASAGMEQHMSLKTLRFMVKRIGVCTVI